MSPSRRDHTNSGKILVVDDEPAEREGLARLVAQWGCEVETASSGEEALDLVETRHPAIREMERDAILRALEETGQDKRRAAQLLGISLKTLYNKLAKYGIRAVKSARLT
ncbi:MAG TPA: helix-turn-helix domain-containing protein [Candidatus Binatia bacterium]|nr:helix-turn-helix domain-containing protein [Candidatus Binatia bacterium]